MDGSFYTGAYRNVFAELGYAQEEIDRRLEDIFQEMFYGPEERRIYHPAGGDMAYIEDTGNLDVRTEGMSYGMMFCVQLDKKEEFDRLWRWAKTYMWIGEGKNRGYFSWSCRPDGARNSWGPAPDGEEFFAMALLFASRRWGDGEGIFQYSAQARDILYECVHKDFDGTGGRSMWDPGRYLIRFIPEVDFTDPSYHLPHFYELFSLYAGEPDRPFWKKAARASREFLHLACSGQTGLSPEYSEYNGAPIAGGRWGDRSRYYSDAYRTIANIALDWAWFAADPWQKTCANRLQRFFCEDAQGVLDGVYSVDGRILDGKALHPTAILAVNAAASLAADGPYAEKCVRQFWDTPLRQGERRYYDNCLYLFAFLALSGKYRIW